MASLSRSSLVPSCILWTILLSFTVSPGSSWSQVVEPDAGIAASQPNGESPGHQVIGPGRVRFSQTRSGQWLSLALSSSRDERLLSGGGFLIVATASDGRLVEVANTGRAGLRPSQLASGLARCCEGVPGGFRAPSLKPDDDGDGRVDEDRLDGVDNDKDGAIDEDFAAIGDEMIVASYSTPKSTSGHQLAFHQELYAWALPHMDGVVMMNLHIRNVGTKPLQHLRVVAYYDRDATFGVQETTVATRIAGANPSVVRASAGVSRVARAEAPSLALMGLPLLEKEQLLWSSGYSLTKEELGRTVINTLTNGRGRIADEETPSVKGKTERGTPKVVGDGGSVFIVSPDTGTLAVGEEVRVDLALVVASADLIEEACATALKTYVGDGTIHYIPPPVSLRPRVVWGSYEAHSEEEGATVVRLEPVGDDPVSPEQISYFAGIDRSLVEVIEGASGAHEIVLRGDVAQKMQSTNGRVTLKGRFKSGEFFEALLRPAEPVALQYQTSREAEIYWRTPGKLSHDLLTGSPNPFRNATTIIYEVPSVIEQEDGTVLRSTGPRETSVKIYNVTGRLVSVLVEEQMFPGAYTAAWSATDEYGNPVASGVYYVKLQIEDRSITKRLTLLK